ncbi:class I SAM-dependent methyltransferase [Sulfurimonas paralvinellae]|uniref:Class I SAM-dependent methyltransferase n=1 Tax=Sulfurimonas paralvinellae TaxID=317658 RepID=A0A7M1B7S5_9BACT|nr:class I SAM-dependent methyltransferase [Sulfurimonas paralvinellae]QOP45750.1 class I SAM-dependent methyltransferase [Sulfurimonas paralvinellae]
MIKLHTSHLTTIMAELNNILQERKPKDIIEFMVVNPDITYATYNGTKICIDGENAIYRGYKTWIDLAHQLKCKMLTPQPIDKNFVLIRYEKLSSDSFHTTNADEEEKYGSDSIFSHIHKNEEAGFLHYFMQALKNINLSSRKRILNLGINSGDEFELIKTMSENFRDMEIIGIDYCASAIKDAQKKFQDDTNVKLLCADINNLNELNLGEFDLIITIGTLQSSNLEYNKLLMSIVQNQLSRKGAMILGWPNCRWIDGEMIYGAKMKNYPFSEMSNLYKDVNFAKKYLQQKKFRVTITGKDYIFVTATSIIKD